MPPGGKQDPKLHTHEVMVLLVFALFLFAVNHSAFAQTKTLESTETKCIPGKGPQGPQQPPKCWSGSGADVDSVAEEGKKIDTDNRVEVGLDGKMNICSTPVPLDINCKPTRPGDVTYCDLRTGSFACRTFSKKETAGAKMAQQLGSLALSSLNPDLQREISAQSMAAGSRELLANSSTLGGTYGDPYCILVPCTLDEEGPRDGGMRLVTLPKSEIERIMNDPALNRNIDDYATAVQQAGAPPELPIYPAYNAYKLTTDTLTRQYMTDTGSEVRLYGAEPNVLLESAMPTYGVGGTGSNIPSSGGDSTFRAESAPPAQMPSVDPEAPYRRIPTWISSTAQKVRNWWYGI